MEPKNKKIKVLYCRVSSENQKFDSQKEFAETYDLIIEEKISGIVPFFLREGGKSIKKMIEEGVYFELHVSHADRLGRDLIDILSMVRLCTFNKINIVCFKQNIQTLNTDGTENYASKLTLSLLLGVAEFNRLQQKKVQADGIKMTKRNKPESYIGRKKGSIESDQAILSKPKNALAVEYLKEGKYSNTKIARLCGLSLNTITKIRKVMERVERESKNPFRNQNEQELSQRESIFR
jgi:DNA invertase Pin-like site-specific DNA recombinase